ncbi:hypothetical protein DVH24_021674 [Malus domestica]|uniref:Trans-cinnamate 4-monooxygenase n=1 Tax=Malus domestica TaxID=3750 RepID=A0A498K2A9_MALDO|nr:hypothetical protein DVH24_021674 [Malus domestica]
MDLLLLKKTLLGLFVAVIVGIAISKLRSHRLTIGRRHRHRRRDHRPTNLAKKFNDCFLLRMGQLNLVVVSSPELAKEVLHTQGVEFGSREAWRYRMVSCRSGKSLAHFELA